MFEKWVFKILIKVHFLIYKLKRKNIYVLTHKIYLKEKIYKIIVFVWIDKSIHTTSSTN
jgi:hypothetical protein